MSQPKYILNPLLKELERNLAFKVQNEIDNHIAQEAGKPAQEYYNNFQQYTKDSIETMQEIQNLHDVNISYEALKIYHMNERDQATTDHERKVENSSLDILNESKGKLQDVQSPIAYATHYNNRETEFYVSGLPKDTITKFLHLEIERTNNKTENLKGNIPNKQFYQALNDFTRSFQKDYQTHQEKALVYHQAKESGLVNSFEKDSSKEFNSKYPHLKPFGEAIKELEDRLDKSNADDNTKFAVNKVNREKFLDKYIDKVAETNIERKNKELQKDNQPQQTQQLQQVQQQAPQEQTVKPANDDIEL